MGMLLLMLVQAQLHVRILARFMPRIVSHWMIHQEIEPKILEDPFDYVHSLGKLSNCLDESWESSKQVFLFYFMH
ncbi:hypothetical protein GLYMA_01G099750v4 [Glycine max]|nr:hypothetical protein GLYMA_01G099750v4 [Glycine max]KAH1162436.1 hypothetical protein GYH30_001075 [Glycine max]